MLVSDHDLGAEFVYMAAMLIHIKPKMLPADPELWKIAPEDDPRQELVDRLLDHELQERRPDAAAERHYPDGGISLIGPFGMLSLQARVRDFRISETKRHSYEQPR